LHEEESVCCLITTVLNFVSFGKPQKKSQRTKTKIVAAGNGREAINILFVFCRADKISQRGLGVLEL
jgi:hypothetical protein